MNILRLAGVFAGGIWLGCKAVKKPSPSGSAYDFSFLALDGSPLPLADFRGKAILVVNTASECGLTPQYEGLEHLYQTYGKDGLVVIGMPSNDFGEQEPGTPEEIKAFTQEKYNITFPLTRKDHAIGANIHPFFAWASAQAGFLGSPKWNFHKFLISPNGSFVDWFASTTKPESASLIAAIESQLELVPEKLAA